MARLVLATLACTSILLSSGCATITSNEMQTVTLTTKTSKGELVDKAKCTLKNDRGSWQADSPGVVAVRRSSEDLMVECKKERHTAIIDHNKGTGYDYPDNLPVKMGEAITVDRRDQSSPPEAAQASSTTKPN